MLSDSEDILRPNPATKIMLNDVGQLLAANFVTIKLHWYAIVTFKIKINLMAVIKCYDKTLSNTTCTFHTHITLSDQTTGRISL